MNEVLPHTIEELVLDGSVDPHLHGRNSRTDNDGKMEMIMKYAADEHEVLVLIGNTAPHTILTQADVDEYLVDARTCIPAGKEIDLYVAPLLTDHTTPEMVYEMRRKEPRTAVFLKGFLSGVSNDYGHSVTDIAKLEKVLHACHDRRIKGPPLPVHWHMERKFDRFGNVLEMRDREWYAIKHDFDLLLKVDPKGSHTVKHVSDGRSIQRIDYLRSSGYNVFAEFASQYFKRTHEDLYEGPGGKGTQFNSHDLAWPLYKSRKSQCRLIQAALSGKEHHFFGSDCAWHVDDPTQKTGVKVTCEGVVCGGTAISPALSKSIVIELFVNAGKAHLLNAFLSRNARRALGLPAARTKVTYRRQPTRVPEVFVGEGPNGKFVVHPFMKGETYEWARVK